MFSNEREEVRRAGSHGLCVAGVDALPFLLSAIDGSAGIAVQKPAGLPYSDPTQNAVVFAIHAVGQLSQVLTEQEAAQAVDVVCVAMAQASAEIQAEASQLPDWVTPATGNPWPNAPLYFPVIERRRTIAEGCTTLGRFGQRARIRNERDVCLKALNTLLSVATQEEPGLEVESYINSLAIRGNAATSLCRVFSGGKAPRQAAIPNNKPTASDGRSASITARPHDGPTQGLAVLVSEAARRAAALHVVVGLDGEAAAVFAAAVWTDLRVDLERTKAL